MLVREVLYRGLVRSLSGHPRSVDQAAMEWAAAYRDYAVAAQAGGLPMVPTGTEVARLAAALAPGLAPTGNPEILASAWVAGLSAFWMTPPAVFTPGFVVTMAGLSAVRPALTLCYSDRFQGLPAACATTATVLDAATRTVAVAIPGVGVVTVL